MTTAAVQRILEQGVQSHQAGDRTAAARCYLEVLATDPENPDAWNLLGVATLQNGDARTAVQHLQTAQQLAPQDSNIAANLSSACLQMKDYPAAEKAVRHALRLDPSNSLAWRHLSSTMRFLGRVPEALQAAERSLELTPSHDDSIAQLGAMQLAAGQLKECVRTLERLTGRRRLRPDVLTNLGSARRQLGEFQDAKKLLDEAWEHFPGQVEVLTNRGNALLAVHRPDEALEMFRMALAKQPNSASALNGLGQALQTLGHWHEALEAFRLAWKLDDQNRHFDSNFLYCASLAPHLSRQELSRLHCLWGQQVERQITPTNHARNATEADKTLTIGYVSPDFRSHATMRFFLPILQHRNREQFRVLCYSEAQREDQITAQVASLADGLVRTASMTDAQLRERIAADGVDVLIDLAGHTAGNRLSVFAGQPAPVQMTWLGYPNTTGLSRIQWFLTDHVRETDQTAAWFSEQLLCMPQSACLFQSPDNAPDLTSPPLLRKGYPTFGSTHRLEKISPSCLRIWAQILNGVTNARLYVFRDVLGSSESVRNSLRRRMSEAGIPMDRVDFGWEIHGSYLHVYSEIDVLMDVFPWASGTTAWEATWMGVPIPTIRAPEVTVAATASLFEAIGVPGLVASDTNDLVRIARQLVTNADQLSELRSTLRQRMSESVCDAGRFTKQFEARLKDAWRAHCTGVMPDGMFRVNREVPNEHL
ncbi:MAG: tetratricopeptide repeat protein [Planctomycetaceae bacterium]|nr:tetratricopeptide repeat protein [Planctomycetaceae bacterium]